MNGPAIQAKVAAQLAGVAETLTMTRPSAGTYTVKAVISPATSAQISEYCGAATTNRPVLIVTLDGTQTAIAANDSFTRDGRTLLIHQPVTTLIGATVITTTSAAF